MSDYELKIVFRLLGTLDQDTKQEQVLEIIDELKEKHGSNIFSPYKFRLWAEMIVRINNCHRHQFVMMRYFFFVLLIL